MAAWARTDRLASRKAIVVGDLNVAPLENDVWNHKRLRRSVGHTPLEAERMKDFWAAGELIDVPRHFVPEPEPLYRSEEHTSELQSLIRISSAVFRLKTKTPTE